jgi:hypothetical protein
MTLPLPALTRRTCRWVRLSDLEPRFVCKACGKHGADVRPDFNWNRKIVAAIGDR